MLGDRREDLLQYFLYIFLSGIPLQNGCLRLWKG
jgi:hypothetical protein